MPVSSLKKNSPLTYGSYTLIYTIHSLKACGFSASEMHTGLVHFSQCKRWFHPETYSLGSADLWSCSACPLRHGKVVRAQILYTCNFHENSFNLQCSTLCMVAFGVTNTYDAVWCLLRLFRIVYGYGPDALRPKTGPLCPSFGTRLQEPRSLSKVPDGPHP
jgi:hypothetical protein